MVGSGEGTGAGEGGGKEGNGELHGGLSWCWVSYNERSSVCVCEVLL